MDLLGCAAEVEQFADCQENLNLAHFQHGRSL
jgi:hypothetical protein